MRIDFTGRHYELDEQVKEFAAQRLEKLSKFLDEPIEVHVILEVERHRQISELNVHHRHGVLQAKEAAQEMRDAIHSAAEKVEKQARRGRKKLVDKRRRAAQRHEHHWPLEVLDGLSIQSGSAPRIIKKTALQIKPMTIDEAALELDQGKNDFFVFLDSSTERVSVLYRRRDNNFGLIAPDF